MFDEANSGKLSLTGDLSVADADDVRNCMLSVLKGFATVRINFSGLEDCDASIMQLVYAMSLQAKKEHKEVRLEGTFSPAVRVRLYANGLISSVDISDEIINSQITQKIRNV